MWRAGVDHETYAWMFRRSRRESLINSRPRLAGQSTVEAATRVKQGKSIVRNAR
jgi:hypothetical protein